MNIVKSTEAYEAWVARQTPLVAEDIAVKHRAMAGQLFPFFRATYFRWAQMWPEVCKISGEAPEVLSVGDLHVENFGTWRDAEGRLIWGVNDFDEAIELPYTNDLVRLATSALLAQEQDGLGMSPREICRAIVDGYATGIEAPNPFVLAERHDLLRKLAHSELRNPTLFWDKMIHNPPATAKLPQVARTGIEQLLPAKTAYRLFKRVAGLGSLGKLRFVAIADHQGGFIAREAKALSLSAVLFAKEKESGSIHYARVLAQSVRCADPLVCVRENWLIRRLAPDCSRIELATLATSHEAGRLLVAMGKETANIHAGAGADAIKDIRKDLKGRKGRWLLKAADAMVEQTQSDWTEWRRHST